MICQGEEGEELEYQSEDKDDESSASEGGTSESEHTTVNVEEKVKVRISNLPQVVAICVVSSFTENANHPDMLALIPTILIDKASLEFVCMTAERIVLLIYKQIKRLFLQMVICRKVELPLYGQY